MKNNETKLLKLPESGLTKILNLPKEEIQIYEASRNLPRLNTVNNVQDRAFVIIELTNWVQLIGREEKVSADQLVICADFIIKNFGHLNLIDIRNAYINIISGTIENNIEYHNEFTPVYIAKVLNAYMPYRRDIIHKTKQSIKRIEDTKPTPKPPKEQSDKNFLIILDDAYKSVNINNTTYLDFGDLIYDFIVKNKLVLFDKKIKTKAKAYAKREIKSEKKKSVVTSVILKRGFNKIDRENLELKKSKEFIVNHWLKYISKTNFEKVKKLLKNEKISKN